VGSPSQLGLEKIEKRKIPLSRYALNLNRGLAFRKHYGFHELVPDQPRKGTAYLVRRIDETAPGGGGPCLAIYSSKRLIAV